MEVNTLTWVITIAVIAGFFIFDFYAHVRTPHSPSIKESAWWSLFYVALACAFGVFLWFTWGEPGDPHGHGVEFFTGYVTEKALSVDNLFIFALIMGTFKVPRQYQQKVLLIGIALALIFRGVFIAFGAAAIEAWSDVFYLFGIWLLWTAYTVIRDEVSDEPARDPSDMKLIKVLNKAVPVSDDYSGDRLLVRRLGKLTVTPLLVCLVAIGMTDLMFALDSIPAIYGITQEPYIVFTTNAFALLGLRQMYFLLDGLLDRLVYLPYGLGIILAFIGVKLVLHALHENGLPFINGGEPVHDAPEVQTVVSLLVIVGVLTVTVLASLWKSKRDGGKNDADADSGAADAGAADAAAAPATADSVGADRAGDGAAGTTGVAEASDTSGDPDRN
ncbi:TerC family protein [Corynebacterium kalidii]|uniref:TerC family protein n=1 Tax=Corynebacterium kalidii TaxID=2931982 RepID=A0A9X2B394_9CORY|nr:TerC family protein [Corynebacterium kalidii]MCJ7859530.1 TerC family protein [Corynebacterium kalidii]